MNLLFLHDHYIYIDKNNNAFSPGKLSSKSFTRYLNHFDTITVLTRHKFIDKDLSESLGFNQINTNKINYIPFDNQSNFKNRFLKRSFYKKKLTKIINQFDAIIVRLPSEIGFLAAEICDSLQKPYVSEVVACPVDAMNGFNNLRAYIYKPLIKKNMEKCVYNSVGSLYVTDSFLQKKYPTKGFQCSASNVELEKVSYIERDIKNKSQLNITLIGNLDSPHKGYNVLYKSLKLLDKKLINKSLTIYLIGPGKKYKTAFSYKNILIKYTGSLNKIEVFKILNNTDIYIQPSNQEGLPRATIEAMSLSIPCITSDAGGLPELIHEKCIHKVNDYKNLANKILFLINNPEFYKKTSSMNAKKSEDYLENKLSIIREDFFNKYKLLLISKINK
ncbi:glycosyltransferase [Proteus vulgaris]